jgi:MFS family permease
VRTGLQPALVVILAGVSAALHIGKLAPAIAALQLALGVTLVQAGFLLSMVQLAGMSCGLAFGAVADGLGHKRSMVLGLVLLSAASAAGGTAGNATVLMALRALEGFGFLLVVLPAPGLVRRLVPEHRVSLMLGVWGAYMPLATATALLFGPLAIGALGWRAWWWGLAGVSLLMAAWLARAVPGEQPTPRAGPSATTSVLPMVPMTWWQRLRQTLGARGPWLVAASFAAYSSQWLAVIGFLPVIYLQSGVSGAATGALTALAAAVNIVGNVASGRLLQAGHRPTQLLAIGFSTMAVCSVAAFAGAPGGGGGDGGLPAALRYAAVLVFSMTGGLIPATLFTLAMRVAPSDQALGTTVGWVQQWSALGQFAGPPLVAWLASQAGGWHWTWLATGACSAAGLALAAAIVRLPAPAPRQPAARTA